MSDAEAQPEADDFRICQVPVWTSYLGIGNPTIPSILNTGWLTSSQKNTVRSAFTGIDHVARDKRRAAPQRGWGSFLYGGIGGYVPSDCTKRLNV